MSSNGCVLFFFCLCSRSLKSFYDFEKVVVNSVDPLDFFFTGGLSSFGTVSLMPIPLTTWLGGATPTGGTTWLLNETSAGMFPEVTGEITGTTGEGETSKGMSTERITSLLLDLTILQYYNITIFSNESLPNFLLLYFCTAFLSGRQLSISSWQDGGNCLLTVAK